MHAKISAQGVLAVRGGVDITNAATLGPALFQGAAQAVCAVGPVFGRLPDGKMGCGRFRPTLGC